MTEALFLLIDRFWQAALLARADFDTANALVQTGDGGYALAGDTHSYGAGDSDFWLIKTDSTGNAPWNRTYGGTIGDAAVALVQTNEGGFAVAGRTLSFGAGNWNFQLVKTDDNGKMDTKDIGTVARHFGEHYP